MSAQSSIGGKPHVAERCVVFYDAAHSAPTYEDNYRRDEKTGECGTQTDQEEPDSTG